MRVNAAGDLYTLKSGPDTQDEESYDVLSSFVCGRRDKIITYTREIVVKGHADWRALAELFTTMQHPVHLMSVTDPSFAWQVSDMLTW